VCRSGIIANYGCFSAVYVIVCPRSVLENSTTMRGNFSSSGNVANGGTNTLSSSYKFYGRDEVLVNDPNTSSPFDQTGFNALQIGPEVVS
jgi:hypothetical protein